MNLAARFISLLLVSASLLAGCAEEQRDQAPVTTLVAPQDCRIEAGCRAAKGAFSVAVRFDTEPRALQPFPVSVSIDSAEMPHQVFVAFSMQGMDMGLNRYRLQADAAGVWKGNVTLPVCVSGRSDWMAEFEFVLDKRRVLLQLPFVLSK